MSGKMSIDLSNTPRKHFCRQAHPSTQASAFSSVFSSDTISDALNESSEGPSSDSSEESSDGASSEASDRLSSYFSRPQRPLFAFGNQGPVFFFGTATNSKASDRVPRGWTSQKKKVLSGDEGHNACPKKVQTPATAHIRNSRVRVAQLPSHLNQSFQPPLFTFFHHLEQEAPLIALGTGATESRSPKRRTRCTDGSQSKNRRSAGFHRAEASVCDGEGLESDDMQKLRNNMGSVKGGTSRPEGLRSMELREQEPFHTFRQSKPPDEQRGDIPIPVVRSADNFFYGQRETSPETMIRDGRNPTIACRRGFSKRHTKTDEGFKTLSGPVYMTGGADGGEGLRHFDEMNDWWERELLNQTEPQPPNLRRQADLEGHSSKTASLKPILKNSRSSFTKGTTPSHSNPVRFIDSEGKLFRTLDN